VEVINNYAKSRQPFLFSVHFNAPHWPWEAPGDEERAICKYAIENVGA